MFIVGLYKHIVNNGVGLYDESPTMVAMAWVCAKQQLL